MSNKVEIGKTVKVHYTGTFEDGEIFDSSYTREEPIAFVIGQNQVIAGFESAVMEMNVNDVKHITLTPEQAYGEYRENMTQEVSKEFVPETVKVGEILTTQNEHGTFNVTVKEVNEDTVILDANHPMAGKTLNFKLELVEVE
jgi:FKBP-type peptidyl-prolyl cis-trans isomerase 2